MSKPCLNDICLPVSVSYGVVIGLSGFAILWGLFNICLIKRISMNDFKHLKKAKPDVGEDPSLSEKQNLKEPTDEDQDS